MSDFNYALDRYALNCCEVTYFLLHAAYADRHMEMANDTNKSGCERFTHGLIWLLEVIPVIGAVAAIFEVIIVKAGGHDSVSIPQSRPTPPPSLVNRAKPAAIPASKPVAQAIVSTPSSRETPVKTVAASILKPTPQNAASTTPKLAASGKQGPPPPPREDAAPSPVLKATPKLKSVSLSLSPSPVSSPTPTVSGKLDPKFEQFLKSYTPAFARKVEGAPDNAQAIKSNPGTAEKVLKGFKDKYDVSYLALSKCPVVSPSALPVVTTPPPPLSKGAPPPPPPKGMLPKGSLGAGGVKKDRLDENEKANLDRARLELEHQPNAKALKDYLLEGYEPEEREALKIGHAEIEALSRQFLEIVKSKKGEKKESVVLPAAPVSLPKGPELSDAAKAFLRIIDTARTILKEYENLKGTANTLIEACRTDITKVNAQKPPLSQVVIDFDTHKGDLKKIGPDITKKVGQLNKFLTEAALPLKKYWPDLSDLLKAELPLMNVAAEALGAITDDTDFGVLKKSVLKNSQLLEALNDKEKEVTSGKWQEPPSSAKGIKISRKGGSLVGGSPFAKGTPP